MSIPKHPIDVPIEIAGTDCIAEVRILSYSPGAGPVLHGDAPDPGWPEEVGFCVEGIRPVGVSRDNKCKVSKGLDAILGASEDIREACLDAIENHNQPPEAKS